MSSNADAGRTGITGSEPLPSLLPGVDRAREGWDKGQQNTDFIVKVVASVYRAIQVLAWIAATPGYVFMRYKFGLRFLLGLNVVGGFIFLTISSELFRVEGFIHGRKTLISQLIIFLYVLLLAAQMLSSYRRYNRGEQWHSRFHGLPWPIWRFLPYGSDPVNVTRFYEPAVVVGLSMLMAAQGIAFHPAVLICGISMFLYAQIDFLRYWNDTLDQQDRMIEAEVIADVAQGSNDKWQEKGVMLPKVLVKRLRATDSPDAQQLLTEHEAPSGDNRQ